jgi:hypothetical protein
VAYSGAASRTFTVSDFYRRLMFERNDCASKGGAYGYV